MTRDDKRSGGAVFSIKVRDLTPRRFLQRPASRGGYNYSKEIRRICPNNRRCIRDASVKNTNLASLVEPNGEIASFFFAERRTTLEKYYVTPFFSGNRVLADGSQI